MKKFSWSFLGVIAVLVAVFLLVPDAHQAIAGLPLLGFVFGTIDVDLYSPITMLEPIETRKAPKTFLKDTFFSGQPERTFDTKTVMVDIVRGGEEMEVFCAPDKDGIPVEREGYKTNEVQPAYVKPLRPLTFKDLLPRMAGESLDVSGTSGRLIAKAARLLGQDMKDLDDRIIRLEEYMCSQLLQEGKIHVLGEGIDHWVDFLMPAENKGTLAADALFTNKDADPWSTLFAICRGLSLTGNRTPAKLILGGNVIEPFLNNPQVIAHLNTERNINLGKIEPGQLAEGVTYFGELRIYGYTLQVYGYDYSCKINGVRTYMMPLDKILIAPNQTSNYMTYGAIQNLKALELNMVEARRFPLVWEKPNGSARFAQLESAPLPNFREADNFACFKVI